jgi:CheY-like chemotaxis protein
MIRVNRTRVQCLFRQCRPEAAFHKSFPDSQRGIAVCGEVSNELEAVEFVKKSRPDLVVLDFAMPDLDGRKPLTIFAAIRRRDLELESGPIRKRYLTLAMYTTER